MYAASNTGPFREREREQRPLTYMCAYASASVRALLRTHRMHAIGIGMRVCVRMCVCTGAADACAMCKGGCYTPAAVREGIFVSKWGIVM